MSRTPVAPEPAGTAETTDAFEQFVELLAAGPTGPKHPVAPGGPGLPSWLAQLAAALFHGQDEQAARRWALRVHTALGRLGGPVPFDVVHDWHAHAVAPLLAEASARRGGDGAAPDAVRRLHERALAGQRATRTEWTEALGPALTQVYGHAYAYADAYATASVNAREYAMDNDYGEEKAAEFAAMYAKLNTDANARSYADANALANTRALAAAFAGADEQAFAEAYPFAYVHVYALADAERAEPAGRDERYRAACARLADGLAEALDRAAG
ncbi:SpcZ [Streptomyces spectabilis]|uniref:SpcZ n=1 Tax=Streptomyces spectabilis TaxID=68270 RepID=A0A516RHI7_STRST|nr:SpcZ [Streptomyces spectabilis]QDQ15123.1 SpcZ [Streptomyces spectabilis]